MLTISILFFLSMPVDPSIATIGFDDFTQRPEVPFEATTFEQDDLIEATQVLGDNQEVSSVNACDTLIADETLPFELRCWAVRQKMKLCTYAKREWEALDAGKAWLEAHGEEDCDPLGIRAMMGQIVSQRGHENFVPLYEDAKAIFDNLFANHPTDNILMVQAHVNYALILRKLSAANGTLTIEGAKHCFFALQALKSMRENTEKALTPQNLAYIEEREAGIRVMQEQLLNMGTSTRMTKEEYIQKWKDKAETVRRMRQERIDRGELDPNELPRTETYAF